MKFLLVISSLLSIAWAQQPTLTCFYGRSGQNYRCEIVFNNPNGFNNFTEIGGSHLEGFTNADVNQIFRRSGTTPNIPKIICETFPNLVLLDLFSSQITEIDDSALSGCSRVTRLALDLNRISSISANAFVNLREVMTINLADNLLTTLPDDVFKNQQNLSELNLSLNRFNDFTVHLFRPLHNLQTLHLRSSNLTEIDGQWFTENPNLNFLNLERNRITLSPNAFIGLEPLRRINLANNGIDEIPPGTFAGLINLEVLELQSNILTALGADSFPDLGQLKSLVIRSNRLVEIDDYAFRELESLTTLDLSSCGIRELNPNSLQNLTSLLSIDLSFNAIDYVPPGTFASMPNLTFIGFLFNRLNRLSRNSFGTLNALQWLDLDGNVVNGLDRAIIDDAVNLQTLYFSGNLCASNFFNNFLTNRAQYLEMLERCFRNMRYIVDTTTEGDGVYSFFEGPSPGIVLRVQSCNEVQVALAPLNFMLNPSIEIFIGAANNTQSVIRINQVTNVVTVSTPNIIQQNQWNDFRVTWANQVVDVFRGNDTFPFMSYTIQYSTFPVNFYGLRSVETRATWSVQPIELA